MLGKRPVVTHILKDFPGLVEGRMLVIAEGSQINRPAIFRGITSKGHYRLEIIGTNGMTIAYHPYALVRELGS